jgi:3-oxoacyl-[acyl-carrier protein] reductase
MEFDGKNVMVTGAGSGIGKEIAIMFAMEGAFVIACDNNADNVKKTVLEIISKKGKAEPIVFDVSLESQVKDAINAIREKFKIIDVLINCAGILFLGKTENITSEQWDRVLSVNLKGTFLVSREVMSLMKKYKRGCIINLTAAAAKTGGIYSGGNYVASKGGVVSLTIHLAKLLAPYGIRVNAICPGVIDTPMIRGVSGGGDFTEEMRDKLAGSIPLGIGYPKDIGYGALFLADEKRARYITGEILDIDGGLFMD